jgi:hypothetical protein
MHIALAIKPRTTSTYQSVDIYANINDPNKIGTFSIIIPILTVRLEYFLDEISTK